MRLPRDAALGGRSSECSDQGEQLAFSDRIALLDLHPSLAAVAPACAATGHIGSFNYGWDGTQTGAGSLTPFSWASTYFSSTNNWTYTFWGWRYKGGTCGTWYNNSFGSSGDIAC